MSRGAARHLVPGVALTLLALAPAGRAGAGEPVVELRDGRLSAVFDETPATEAAAAVEARAGIRLILPPALRARVLSARLAPRPVDASLRALVRAFGADSFTAVYDADGKIRRVMVLEPSAPRAPGLRAGPALRRRGLNPALGNSRRSSARFNPFLGSSRRQP